MRICILGATGLVGRETLALASRAWPAAQLTLFASRDQSVEHDGRKYEVRAATALEGADAPRGDLALVALDDDHSKKYVPRLLELGYRVIDKSNTYRADPKVPLVVAGVNDRDVAESTRLVANPNCTTIPLALALQPLHRALGLRTVTVSTYQAVSGAGIAALDGFLEDSRKGYADPERLGLKLDVAHYAGNTVPHNGKTDEGGFSAEERKLMFESRKILSLPDLDISAQCCRVAVAVGHYENAWVTFDRPAELRHVNAALERAPFVRWFPGASGDGLTALASVQHRDLALVGRARVDGRGSLCLTVVGDNLRLGAATNAVRIASRWFKAADAALQVAA